MQHLLRKRNLVWENAYALDEAEAVLLGVPFDSTVTGFPGARFAPNAIREDFQQLYSYDEARGDLSDLKVHDCGNLEVVHGDAAATHKRVFDCVKWIREENAKAKLVVLGGEHSITLPIVQALKANDYLCFDAHWDLLDDYEGLRLSHTCVNRRIHESDVNVEVRGVRTGEKEEYDYAKKLSKLKKPDYVSIDVDVLDAVPTSCPVPSGWTLEELWKQVSKLEFNACDVVEYNPLVGKNLVPAELVRRLLLNANGL